MSSAPDRNDDGLTGAQLAAFHRDGYLIVPDALPPATVAALLAETHRLLSTLDLSTHPLTRFRTGGEPGQDHVGDAYFLTSGDKIRFFLEEDAFDPATGELARPPRLAVNKIGHCLHGLSAPFAALLSTSPSAPSGYVPDMLARPAAVARQLGYADPRVLQSMVICKQPGIGAAVPPHQDSTFLYTDPPSAVGFWYALEDATLANACLSFLPGSHRWAGVDRRLVRKRDPTTPGQPVVGTEMVANEAGARFPAGEGKAGSLVLIHGNLLHASERNLSEKGRIIYTFHIIEGAEGHKYDERNWLQPPPEGFTRLYS